MKVSKERSAANYGALINSASKLFKEQGFAATGVAQISAEAGLSQGAFYGHFASKNSLAVAACRHSMQTSNDWSRSVTGSSANGFKSFVDAYLSPENLDNVADGCPMAAYVCEVKGQDVAVKEAFAEGLEEIVRILQKTFTAELASDMAHRKSLFAMCSLVGSVAMARAVGTTHPLLAEQIIDATKECLHTFSSTTSL